MTFASVVGFNHISEIAIISMSHSHIKSEIGTVYCGPMH